MKTNDLRKAIISKLMPLKSEYNLAEIYFYQADDKALYPHLVVNMMSANSSDFFRTDYTVDFDIWTRNNPKLVLDLSDKLEDIFCNFNSPEESILPTFFTETRGIIDDPDKNIVHGVVRISCQLYENE